MTNIHHHSLLSDFDISLFKAGKHYKLYEKLGSHTLEINGQWGTHFAVWAPSATSVSVIGDFNYWDKQAHHLAPRWDSSGIWEGFIPGVGKGALYKYCIEAPDGRLLEKGDPFALYWEQPPRTCLLYTSPSPRDATLSRMPSSA